MKDTLGKKFTGCMIGAATGDALGSSFEGQYSPEPDEITFTGRWTDDTHMMMGVAESLIESKGFDGDHMAHVFMRNYEAEPWRGYAIGPPAIFRMMRYGVSWREAAKRLFGGEGSYGNGGAMRVAPVGLLYHHDLVKVREIARDQARITHAHPLGTEGAELQACAVALAVRRDPSREIDVYEFLEELEGLGWSEIYRRKLGKIRELLRDASRKEVIAALGNGIEAPNSVPAAVYCFLSHLESFEDALIYAIRLGGDTDTIGAMTGAISGAYHGEDAIPIRWKNSLEKKEYLRDLAAGLRSLWEETVHREEQM